MKVKKERQNKKITDRQKIMKTFGHILNFFQPNRQTNIYIIDDKCAYESSQKEFRLLS